MGCEERARLPRNHTKARWWKVSDSWLLRARLRAASYRAALSVKAETVADIELCVALHGASSTAARRDHRDQWECGWRNHRDGRCRSLEISTVGRSSLRGSVGANR